MSGHLCTSKLMNPGFCQGTWVALVASKQRPKGKSSGASAMQAPASQVAKKSPSDLTQG